ncbi:MAG: IS66 family transposase [Anaerolineae bacterium]|jgi:transposase
MDERNVLKQLSIDELVEIILALQAKVQALEERLNRPPKTPHNSSTPPSQERKAKRRKQPQAKRGPKEGHPGTSRTQSEPDITVELRVERCAACGADLRGVPQTVIGHSQVVELPPVRPVVIEARRCTVECPFCGQTQSADYPAGLEPERVFGPRLEASAHYLHLAHPLSYVRTQDILRNLFGLDISLGALVNVVKRASGTFHDAAQAILDDIRTSGVIGSDETGARIDGQTAWLWTLQTPVSAYYTIAPTRGAAVLENLMGDTVPMVWVSDLAKAQLKQPATLRQICLAHQTRDLQYAIDAHRCAWAYHFQALLFRAQRLGRQRDTMPPHEYGRQVVAIERACDTLLDQVPHSPDSQNLRRRFLQHRDHLFTFLVVPNVPSTNNASEQALRNSVVYRKVTGGFRSDWGATAYANVVSVIETARRRSHNLLDTLLSLLTPPLDLSLSFATQGE